MAKFVPQRIGAFDEARYLKIKDTYEKLTGEVSLCFQELLEVFEGIEISDLFDYLQAPLPQKWLTDLYAQGRQKEFPDFDLHELIKSGSFKLPEALRSCAQSAEGVARLLREVRDLGFIYPLADLHHPTEKEPYMFEIDQAFLEAVEKDLSEFTRSQKENELLGALNQIRDGLNELNFSGVINFRTHGTSFLGMLGDYFERDRTQKICQINVKRNVFQRTKLNRFAIKRDYPRQRDFKELFTLNGKEHKNNGS